MVGAEVLRRFSVPLIVASLGLPGCASLKTLGLASNEVPASAEQAENEEDEAVDSVAQAPAPTAFIHNNAAVKKWVEYFTNKDRERFQRFLTRGKKYRKVIEDFLVENDLPAELYFLALVESGYQNHAFSHAKAAGVWQFIPGTARRYGLQVDRYIDERQDPIRATEAAAKYLRDLYNIFGSWPLAMAAYNAGEYRIIGAIVKGKSRDYWVLCDLKVIPPETRDYVPKIMAAALIGANPEQYGFQIPEEESYPALVSIEVPSPVSLNAVASAAGITVEQIRNVNPHLRGVSTPANQNRYEIWFPEVSAEAVRAKITQLAPTARAHLVAAKQDEKGVSPQARANRHIVRSGENLSMIAQKHGTTVAYLKRVNGIRKSRIFPGMELRVSSRVYRPDSVVRYRVQSGDSLTRIAKRFGVSVTELKRTNTLRGDDLNAGQSLLIRKRGG